MKLKFIVSVLYLSFFLASCTTKKERVEIEKFSDGKLKSTKKFLNANDTNSYSITIYNRDGSKDIEAEVQNGKYIGKKIAYYQTGKIRQIDSLFSPCDTSYNLCDGVVLRYYESGKLAQKYTVRNHRHNGLTQQYNVNGILVKEYDIKDDSIKDGAYREFYESGKIAFLATFKKDTLAGLCYYFNQDGDTLKLYNHYKGNIDFPYKKWLDNGQILYGEYLDPNEKIVVWRWYDRNYRVLKERRIITANEKEFIVPD